MEQVCRKKCQSSRLIILSTGILFSLLISWVVPAYAMEQVQIPLTKFNAPGIVKLGDNDDGYTVKVPSPRRWQIEEARLHIAYVNSTALLANRSRLVIIFNEYPLGQVTLEPGAPEGLATVTIPARLFEAGYNDLQIQVAQDFKDEGCIPHNPPEVWTSLRFIDSTLELSYTPKEVPLSMASVADFLFDPKISGKNQVHIITETLEKNDIYLAAVTAAAVALRFDYRSVHFSTGQNLLPGRDNIVIGRHSFLKQVAVHGEIQGDMGILPMVGAADRLDRKHGLLYLGGTDAEEIRKSVEAFSILSLPLPDIQSCRISDVRLPLITPYSGKNRLEPEKRFTFKELGLGTISFRGYGSQPTQLEFTLPANLLLEENRDISIHFDLSYAAAMREDSILSLDVNGKFVASVPLSRPEGGQYRGYIIRLPLSYLHPGRNMLRFKPVLIPLHTGSCELLQDENLALTLFDSSFIKVPKLLPMVKMPQLSYLFNDGFPLTVAPDFSQTTLMLPQPDRKTLAAALTFVAGVSRRTGVLPYQLTVTSEVSGHGEGNLLVIGPRTDLPAEIIAASPLAEGISMPVHGRLPGTLRVNDWQDQLQEYLFDDVTSFDPVTPDIAILGTDLKIKPQQAVLSEFESPFKPMQTVIVLTAENSDDVLHASEILQDVEVMQQCRNDFVLIDFDGRKPVVQAASLSRSYSVGEITVRNRITHLIDKFRWPFIWLMIGLLVTVSLMLTILLKSRRAKRLQALPPEEE